MKTLDVIVDLQFGSTGKGLLAGYLAKKKKHDTIVIAWAPNAGHTFIDEDGTKYVHCMMPNGVVSPNLKTILIGPGSVIDPVLMMSEIERLNAMGLLDGVKLAIHEHAAVVTEEDRNWERQHMVGIGSTMKGVGRAVTRKIERNRDNIAVAYEALRGSPLFDNVINVTEYNDLYDDAEVVMVEGHQGFSLSINQGFYPFTTSRDCTTAQILSDCGIPLPDPDPFTGDSMTVWGSCRTYPIRVANRFNAAGEQIGWSGPHYPDQHEIEWSEIGREPELTTVTKLPRRIFTWSDIQIKQACRMNRVDRMFLNFVNYIDSSNVKLVLGRLAYEYPIDLVGMGPTFNDVRPIAEFE